MDVEIHPIMESKLENRQRNAHKRHSGIQDANGQFVQRRTSKRTSSNDRHGHVYPDDFSNATIRAVPPDSPPRADVDRYLSDSGIVLPRSATPQSVSRRGHQPRSQEGLLQNNHNRSGSSSRDIKSSHAHSRPRTRTLEERFQEKSPPSLVSSTRHRLGSLNSSPFKNNDEVSTSIGFPSIIPSPPLEFQSQSRRRRVPKSHSRTLSPIRNPASTSRNATLSPSAADVTKILQLIKTTCGRMHGILSFRTPSMGSWSSGYCAINVATGSLIYQTKGDVTHAKTLVSDLRGCQVRTLYDGETHSTFLDVSTRPNAGIHLRPHVPETFDSWLAALLCWQLIRPKDIEDNMMNPPEPLVSGLRQSTPSSERRLVDRRRNSESIHQKDASIIKVGRMLIWDKDARSSESSPLHNRRASIYKTPSKLKSKVNPWRRVSCTLQENGHFKLYTDISDVALLSVIPLTQLSRCAIQRLDPSVLESEFSLAIYPQYPSTATSIPAMKTTYLALESRVLFEVWFVMLRAFTVPDLYGPEQILTSPHVSPSEHANVATRTPSSNMFRVERQLSLRIIEAKLHSNRGKHSQGLTTPSRHQNASKKDMVLGNYYAEVQLDGEVRAKTAVKLGTSNPFWREDFEFFDLPPVLLSTLIEVKTQNPGQRDWTLVSQGPLNIEGGDIYPLSLVGDIEISPLDMKFGSVDLKLDDIEKSTDTERWWPIVSENGEVVGELLMKARIEESVVLMGRDYQPLSELLHNFSNGLTNQIAQLAHPDLRRLSEILLNIFQVSGQASEWIMSLVEDEIDNIHKETPISKFRYGRRIASNDSYESGVEREMILRDLGKSATVEANLLFRGNSLLTKALDLHMRRLGKEYLEDTLCERMRDIDESDPECEVDPNKVENPEDLKRNWRNLIALTETIWRSIYSSASRCPPELRMIFRHIRSCADDRYGDFLRTVAYSSVSGFLFLRFFCPAVLNPKLFGLIKEHPRPRAHRTLTLITKALQTLSNLSTFGSKEPWMEPMNQFLSSHRQEFKTFVDAICGISPDRAGSSIPPSYAAPITILGRLPGTSREGFPSLPYLIDQARECAGLVNLWLEARYDVEPGTSTSDELRRFDTLCEQSQQKTKYCLSLAEQNERTDGAIEPNWEELAQQIGRKSRIRSENGRLGLGTRIIDGSLYTSDSSTSSLEDGYFSRNTPLQDARSTAATIEQTEGQGIDDDRQSSGDETNTPPVSSPAVWDPGVHGDEETMSTQATKDDDEDSFEQLAPNTLGSSMYSLGTNPSNKLVKSQRDSGHRSKHDKVAKSTYSLDPVRHSERGSGSKSSTPSRTSAGGYRDRAPSGSVGKGMYRLNTSTGGDRKSSASRDGAGGILRGDSWNLFKKKGRE